MTAKSVAMMVLGPVELFETLEEDLPYVSNMAAKNERVNKLHGVAFSDDLSRI
jgi:hypothetical protein